jgi:hypothetical protein
MYGGGRLRLISREPLRGWVGFQPSMRTGERDVCQSASADRDIRFTVRVHRVSRHESLDLPMKKVMRP